MTTSPASRPPSSDYPRPLVAVDIVAIRLIDRMLNTILIRRGNPPFEGTWALPGGFVNIDEAMDAAAARELREETGLSKHAVRQVHTFGDPARDPRGRVISVAYLALLPPNAAALRAADDAADADWFPVNALPPLAFDHSEIIQHAMNRLRIDVQHSTAVFELLFREFTLTELQTALEAILSESLDKRNFRRKVLRAELVVETCRTRSGEGRPARLYRRNGMISTMPDLRR